MEQGKRTAIISGRILSTLVILFMIVDGIGHVPRQSSSLSGSWTATHVRMGQPFYFPVVFGVLTWLALYLRDSRLRTFIPLTNS
ncbi:MAG TPA: hypothetical protein VF505_05265 [Thermoanaerobaculia bacterium]